MADHPTETDPESDPFVELLRWVARQAGGVETLASRSKVSGRTLGDWLNGKYPRQRASAKLSQLDDWAVAHIKDYPPEQMPRSLADLAGPIGILAAGPAPGRLHRLRGRRRPADRDATDASTDPEAHPVDPAAGSDATVHNHYVAEPPMVRRRTAIVWCLAAAVLTLAAALVVVAVTWPRTSASSSATSSGSTGTVTSTFSKVEQAGKYGANTFADPFKGSGEGTMIGSYASVEVGCRVYSPIMGTVSPDGYWYRLVSAPWQNRWAPANSFMNGDVVGGLVQHNTDFQVPVCS